MAHCDDNLREISQAVEKYRAAYEGAFPPNLELLAQQDYLTLWELVCPANHYPIGESSYVYRAADLPSNPRPEMIIAYDRDPVHKDRRNTLFADGAVRRMPEKIFEKAIREDNGQRQLLKLEQKPV